MEAEKKYKKKKRLGSYPFLSAVFSNTLALLVIGLFGLLVIHANKLTSVIRENLELQVYLDKNLSQNNKIRISKTLSSKDYIAYKDGEPQVQFIDKKEAAAEFLENTGEDVVEFLGDNPLRDAYILKLKPDFYQADSLVKVQKDVEAINGVFEVVYVKSLVESINENITKIGFILLGFALVLLIAVSVLINNTIKLALFSQRFLIRSMQLVGATAGFIKRPFLYRSLLHGIIAGVLASLILYILLQWAYAEITDLILLADWDTILILFSSLIILGGLIGFFSTRRAINRYLKMSLDELY